MSAEKRPQKFFTTEFTKVMWENFTPVEKAHLSSEAAGFKGDIGIKIAELQREGLGRIIGIPTKKSDPAARGSYQEVAYSLPLPDKSVLENEKRVLLVIPHQNGYDMAIVTPMKASGRNKDKENERIAKKFEQIFSPSEEPYIFSHTWNSEPGVRAVRKFVDTQRKFFAQYHVIPREVSFEEMLNEAIKTARASKESKDREIITLWDLYGNKNSGQQDAA